MSVHEELEKRLAIFKHVEAVLVFTSGFTANSGCIPAVLTPDDVVISDELNHASIIDGVRLSPAHYKKSEGYVYAHKDMEQLEQILKKAQHFKKRMIITDGVFSMDGDIAPLPDIVRLAEEHDAFVMVDDAHASGVLGKNGAGSTSHFNLYGRVDIQLGTLSKALGVVGGYIAGSAVCKRLAYQPRQALSVLNRAPSYGRSRFNCCARYHGKRPWSPCRGCGTTPAGGRAL